MRGDNKIKDRPGPLQKVDIGPPGGCGSSVGVSQNYFSKNRRNHE